MCERDSWQAATSDGRRWSEHDDLLHVEDHSPWRELEALCLREGLMIVWAQVNLPTRFMAVDANGFPLTCGELLVGELSIAGEFIGSRRYRWLRRDEPTRALWGVIGENGAWQFETTPGQQECPQPTD